MATDFQNRVGSKFGGGGVAGEGQAGIDRRERLRKLALEVVYARQCIATKVQVAERVSGITQELSRLVPRAYPRQHQSNLARRAAREAKDSPFNTAATLAAQEAARNAVPLKSFVKVGAPGFSITKLGLLFQLHLPLLKKGVRPVHRFMSAFEQRVEEPNRDYQYVLVAAEPYATVAFRIQSRTIDETEGTSWSHYDQDTATYSFQFLFQ